MPPELVIEAPANGATLDALNIRVEGWVARVERPDEILVIEARVADRVLGTTRILFRRPDASRSVQPESRRGFSLSLNAPELLGRAGVKLEVRALGAAGALVCAGQSRVDFHPTDHRVAPYGELLNSTATHLPHRDGIYGSGPSVHETNPDCLALVRRYLGPGRRRVLDVGCGVGAYGRPLRADGHDWFGVEVKPSDCAELVRLGLPHQQVDGRVLPFEAASFDDAICIEVLEHIAHPDEFLAEIRRVIRRRLLVSVPNLELLPYLHPYAVVPWHLLEADHRNFFHRSNLRHLLAAHFRHVEVLDYAPLPLRSLQGQPLHIHLFAICEA